MNAGLEPKLPLIVDETDGPYNMIKNELIMFKQNLKNIVLTTPGERLFNRDFGVGVRRFLFENNTSIIEQNLRTSCIEQCDKYLPQIKILNVIADKKHNNSLNIKIFYRFNIPIYIVLYIII
jgi:phage baseplate assembly protein W